MIKIQYIILSFFLISCSSKINVNCNDVKIQDYYYKVIDMRGTIKLFTPLDCDKSQKLNKLIIKNSDLILTNEDKTNFLLGNKASFFFTIDSINYHKSIEDKTIDLTTEIVTDVFYISNDILTYKIIVNDRQDKSGPYYEYVNIDLKENKLINFEDLIELKKKDSFKNFINSYVDDNVKKVIENYKEDISKGYGDLLISYQLVFEKQNYDIKRVEFKIDTNGFSHFTSDGIVFKVNVKDENFLLDEERNRVEEYVSSICIPYKKIEKYYNKRSNLYKGLIK